MAMTDRRRRAYQIIIIIGTLWVAVAVGIIGWVTWDPMKHFPRSGMTAAIAVSTVALGREMGTVEDTTSYSFFDQVYSAETTVTRPAITPQQGVSVLDALHQNIYTAETPNYTPLTWTYHQKDYVPTQREETGSDTTQDRTYACRYTDDAGSFTCQETISLTTPEAVSYLATITLNQKAGNPNYQLSIVFVPSVT